MDRTSVDWRGYIPAITTPFTEDGDSISWSGWSTLLDWMIEQGMHGLVVSGSVGEWFSLTAAERKELFRTSADQVAGRIPVIGGCNALTAAESISYAEAAQEAGLEGILLAPPPYSVPNSREIVHFYRQVSNATDIPICIYNWPRGTNVALGADILDELADIDNIVAVKNSTMSLGDFVEGFFRVKDRVRYFGFSTDELGATLVREHGGDGTIGGGGILGSDHPSWYESVWAGDLGAARRYGERDRLLFRDWITSDFGTPFGSAPAILKAALELQGLPGGPPRPPYLPLTQSEKDRVARTLKSLDIPIGTGA